MSHLGKRMAAAAIALALLGADAAAQARKPAATTATEIVAVRVPGGGPIEDVMAKHWSTARPVKVPMLPQTVTLPHHPTPAVTELTVRAVHNGGWIAFLIEWKDPTRSTRIVLDNFGDQVAVQLPIDIDGAPPSPMMGHAGGRVNIMQWRAAFQTDIDHGPRTITDLYPHAWADVYPDEVLTATNDQAVNQRVHDDADGAGIWVNSADDPERYDIKVKVTVSGSDMEIDFSGCSPQREGGMNSRTYACAYIAYKALTVPLSPVNEGSFAALKVVIPEGNMMMAKYPVLMAGWSGALPTVVDTVWRALAEAMPDRIPAAHSGTLGATFVFFGYDPRRPILRSYTAASSNSVG